MPPPMKQAHDKLDKMKQYLSVGMETCRVVCSDVLDNYKHESKPGKEKMAELEDVMLQFCKMDRDLQDFRAALDHVETQQAQMDEDDPADLEDILNKKLRELKEKSKKKDITNHDEYISYKESLLEQLRADGDGVATPQDSDSVEVEDEDLEMTEAEVSTKCPITGKEMVRPVRNTVCGHRYDRDGVLNLIKQRKGRAMCPIGGCANQELLSEENLEEDRELRKFIMKKGKEQSKKGKKT